MLLETGDAERAAEMDALLAELWWYRGEPERSSEHLERAYALVNELAPSPAKAHVISQVARYRMLAGAREEAIRIGEQALAIAEELGLRELQAHALVNIGTARTNMGDSSGIEELQRAIEIASATGSPDIARASNNLGASYWMLGDLRRGLEVIGEAVGHGERVGAHNLLFFSRNFRYWLLSRTGSWDVALPHIEEFLAACEAGEPHYHEGGMRLRRGAIRLARDDLEGALDDIQKASALARRAGDPQQWVHWFSGCARLLVVAGRVDDARPLAHEALRANLCPGRSPTSRSSPTRSAAPPSLPSCSSTARRRSGRPLRASCCHATSFRPPTFSTRSVMPSSSRSRDCARPSNLSPKGAAPKRTSSCSAPSRSGARSKRRDTSVRPRRSWPRRPRRRRRAPSGRALP